MNLKQVRFKQQIEGTDSETVVVSIAGQDKLTAEGYLPKSSLSSEFVFAKENDFFVYPNNYNHFVKHFTNTFQHGGVSLEEVLIPYVELEPKSAKGATGESTAAADPVNSRNVSRFKRPGRK